MSEEIIIFGVPLVTFTIATFLSFQLGKLRMGRILAGIAAICVAFSGLMVVFMEQASGWDGLIYLFALLGISAPVTAGGLIGGIIGWSRGGPNAAT